MKKRSKLDYPMFPRNEFKQYDYVYIVSDSGHYKYGGVVMIVSIPDHCSGYKVQDDEMHNFHVQEEEVIRLATESEQEHFDRNQKFKIEMSYIENSM